MGDSSPAPPTPEALNPATPTSPGRRRRRGSRGGRNLAGRAGGQGSGGQAAGGEGASQGGGGPAAADTLSADGGARSPASEADGLSSAVAPSAGNTTNDAGPQAPGRSGSPAEAAGPPALAPRPKIGDSRPAPGPPGPPLPPRLRAGADRGATGAERAGLRGGTGSQRRTPAEGDDAGRRRRRGRGGRSGRARPVSHLSPVEADLTGSPAAVDEETLEKRRGRERNGRPVGRYLMVVHVHPVATQIAVLEGRSLIEHYVSRPADDSSQIDGNIYLGRVQNVLPGMEAAFIDIGTPKNAVLYRGDVRYDADDVEAPPDTESGDAAKPTRGRLPGAGRDARIEQLIKPGQTVLCQVTKNPIGAKGARLTQEVSIPGRFVVLIPGSDTYGISKRLPDEERKRLRRILDGIRPPGHGLIVRTAAEGATADELQRDVERLTRQWERIDELAKASKAPALLYREPDMALRVIREEFNRNYRGVVIDDRSLYEEVREYVASISPELADRVEYAGEDDPLPVFERHHIHEQIHKALDRKVWLPSGGSLIIERTEALTVIDVNTGKNVGTSNLEETVFRNNLEAAEEIARQLRLRDIGGIIVIDFIDMEITANRAVVIKAFRDALARDKTRTQVFDISELGLVEMTRKRISEGLVESLSETCPTCAGRGIVFDDSLLT
ncbi:MAG: Rne/Rng family ribonuclease [Acidimicrobiales bacterium]